MLFRTREDIGRARERIVSLLCIVVLGFVLVIGLWPFHSPRNGVCWLKSQNGLHFKGHGTVISSGAFRIQPSPSEVGSSVEMWITPERIGGGTILAFDSSPDPRIPFALRQYGRNIAVQRYLVDENGNVTHPWFEVKDVFTGGKRVLITITSGAHNTALYVDGILKDTTADPGITARELTGRLVLANSTVDDSWAGTVTGFATYARELTPSQVMKHFESWTPDHGPLSADEPIPTTLYLFNERAGNTIHNQYEPGTDLVIPRQYLVLHPAFLRSILDLHFHGWNTWSVWRDVGINIVGFVPVGFLVCAYCPSVGAVRWAAPLAILLGLFLSLTVEALQWFLPTRDSGMSDLVTNTTGAALGTLMYRSSHLRARWNKALEFIVSSLERKRSTI